MAFQGGFLVYSSSISANKDSFTEDIVAETEVKNYQILHHLHILQSRFSLKCLQCRSNP